MPIDMDKLNNVKSQIEAQLSRSKGGSRARFWIPKNGKNHVRILPEWATEGDFAGQFWREVVQHWNVSDEIKGPVTCVEATKYLTGSCPICAFIKELKEQDNPAATQLAYDIRRKAAWLLNVVDLKDPVYTASDVSEFKESNPDREVPFEVGSPKLQVFAAPVTVFDQIAGLIRENKKDITDRQKGYNLFVVKHQGKDKKLTRYEVIPEMDPSAAPIDPDTEITDLSSVGKIYEFDEMVKLLANGVGAGFKSLTSGSKTTKSLSKGEAEKLLQEKLQGADSGDALMDLEAAMKAALSK